MNNTGNFIQKQHRTSINQDEQSFNQTLALNQHKQNIQNFKNQDNQNNLLPTEKMIRQSNTIRIQNIRPFSHLGQSWFEFLTDIHQSYDYFSKTSKNMDAPHKHLHELKLSMEKQLSQNKIKEIMDHQKKTGKLQFKESNLQYKKEISQLKQVQQREDIQQNKCFELIAKMQANKSKIAQLKVKNTEKNDQLSMYNKKYSQIYDMNKFVRFERAIIKMQFGNSFYRYGGRVQNDDFKLDALNLVKWDIAIDSMEVMIDLKIFVIATITPMSRFLFNDFSPQANIFKALFGFGQNISPKQISQIFDMIRKRINKHFVSSNTFINNGQKNKMIFVCNRNIVNNLINQMFKNIQTFSTQIMTIEKINFKVIQGKFQNTQFQHGNLQIKYKYEKSIMSSEFEVLYCTFENITKKDFDIVRKKVLKNEPVFCWVDFPVALHQDRIQEIEKIHQMLEKCKFESFGTQKG